MKSFYLEQAKELNNRIKPLRASTYCVVNGSSPFKFSDPIPEETIEEIPELDIIAKESNLLSKTKVGDPAPDLSEYKVVQSEGDQHYDKNDVYKKTYTTFSGCDLVVSFGDKVYGELQSIEYTKFEPEIAQLIANSGEYCDGHLLEEHPVILVIKMILFNQSQIIENGSDITLTFANEYGHKSMQSIFDVHVLTKTSGYDLDMLMTEEVFICYAKDITPLTKMID